MKPKITHYITMLVLCLCVRYANAQKIGKEKIDSMIAALSNLANDTTKVKKLNSISFQLGSYDPKTGLTYGKKALNLAKKLKWKKGIAAAYNSIGGNYLACLDNTKALEFFNYALSINQKNKYYQQAAQNLGNIALVYEKIGDYPKALENLFGALKQFELLNDNAGISTQYGNIGNIYQESGNPRKAIYYDSLAMIEYKKMGDKEGEAIQLGNIANALSDMGEINKAIEYGKQSLKLYEKLGYLEGILRNINNLGVFYESIGDFSKAMEYHFKALELNKGNEIVFWFTISNGNIGELYLKLYDSARVDFNSPYIPGDKDARLKLATRYLKKAVELAQNNQDPINFSFNLEKYSIAQEKNGDFMGALQSYRKHTEIQDSIFSIENSAKIEHLTTEREVELKNKQIEIEKLQLAKKHDREIFFMLGIAALLVVMGLVFKNYTKQKKLNGELSLEKKKSDDLLLNILPEEVAEELKAKGSADAQLIDEVTVLFTDFKDFTKLSEKLTPKELVAEINECFSAFDHIMQKHGVEKIKTIGDAYMAAGGLPTANNTHAEDVVKAALDIQKFMDEYNAKKEGAGQLGFEIRIGVHTGPVVAGIVGVKKFAYDIWGDTVNTASRMESSGEEGKVNISGTTYELVKDKFNCIHRGKITAKGKGEIDMYFVEQEI